MHFVLFKKLGPQFKLNITKLCKMFILYYFMVVTDRRVPCHITGYTSQQQVMKEKQDVDHIFNLTCHFLNLKCVFNSQSTAFLHIVFPFWVPDSNKCFLITQVHNLSLIFLDNFLSLHVLCLLLFFVNLKKKTKTLTSPCIYHDLDLVYIARLQKYSFLESRSVSVVRNWTHEQPSWSFNSFTQLIF